MKTKAFQPSFDAFMPDSDWKAPNLDDLPQDWNVFKRLAYDTETRDELLTILGPGVRRGAYPVGYSIAFEDGPCFYLPSRHEGGGNLDPDKVEAYMRHCAKRFEGTVAGAHLAYDLDISEEIGITFDTAKWFRDVQVAEPLLDENQFSYSLDNILKRRLGLSKDEDLLFTAAKAFDHRVKTKGDAKGILWRLPAKYVGPYAEGDTRPVLHLLRTQEREIEAQGLGKSWDLESRLVPVLTKMRRRGLRVDETRLAEVEIWAKSQEREALEAVFHHSGVRIELGHSMNVDKGAAMLRSIGHEPPKSRTGKPSITKEVLESIDHPASKGLRRARKMAKLQTTYCQGVRDQLTHGRVHCTFNQLRATKEDGSEKGVITGRISIDDPCLTNQPVRDDEIAARWLRIYIPEEGCLFNLNDYSQQEPRWLVEWGCKAGAARLAPKDRRGVADMPRGNAIHKAALEFAQRYRNDPTTDFHIMTSLLTYPNFFELPKVEQDKIRKRFKAIGLGNIYAKGGPKLCRELGLPTRTIQLDWGPRKGQWQEVAGEEGQAVMDAFNEGVPFAKAMSKHDMEFAQKHGYVTTWTGRRCRFEKDLDGNIIEKHKALNKRIQGSAADQTKTAIVALDREGVFLQLQIYDSLGSSVSDLAAGRRICEIMEHCVPMEVEMKADLKIGPSWGELESA